MMISGLVDSETAAKQLGISRTSLYRIRYAYPDFPQPQRVGRTLLFDPRKLRAWRKQHPARPYNRSSG